MDGRHSQEWPSTVSFLNDATGGSPWRFTHLRFYEFISRYSFFPKAAVKYFHFSDLS